MKVLGEELVGKELMEKYGGWPMYSKFFDNENPLFHHLHLTFEAAARVGKLGKPENYYFPKQLNNYFGEANYTYFGFDPDVDPEEIKKESVISRMMIPGLRNFPEHTACSLAQAGIHRRE